jgi:hypothetical protein
MHLEDASYSARATWQYWSVAVFAVLHWATASGRTKRRASLIICISRVEAVPHTFLPFDTWPTWAYPARYRRRWLLRPSQCCVFLPCLTVGATTTRVAQGRSVSMFCIQYRMDLGPLCYTGRPVSSRRATLESPDSTACHFGWSLNQPRMAPCSYSAYERSVSLTMSSDSSSPPV